jgi:hypothetical protein
MDRPLWRILLPILILVLALHRAGLAAFQVLGPAEERAGVLLLAHGAEAVAAIAAALGLWLGRTWAAWAILALGVALGATGLLQAFYLGVRPPAAAVAQLLAAALGAGALGLLIRRELAHPAVLGDADDPEGAAARRSEQRYPRRHRV